MWTNIPYSKNFNIRVMVTKAKLGGNWNNSSSCSSQSVNVNNWSANVNSNNGRRSSCDTGSVFGASPMYINPFSAELLSSAKAGTRNRSMEWLVKLLKVTPYIYILLNILKIIINL